MTNRTLSVADPASVEAVSPPRRRRQDQPYEVFEAIGYLVARSSRRVDGVGE
jgi:hypothetical protein